ncbi:hypothetical protein RHMOL_Rhmol04G0363100 [Rhododendron molle]|uniref:Uncharacterized protein n=1 Tax=Rhododendron molle TaxID=49168 RepID=A0ACC0P7Q8_RHOML|nr:hypothetical protein RHMOL_Rhmol04G0363100 [Rhododendron molle]
MVPSSSRPPFAIKINCDGAFNSSCSLAAFGVIARDCGGKAPIWRVGRVVVSSAVSVEAWALRIACSTAMEMNYPRVIFDLCQKLISCINDSKRPCPWEISSVVEDIKAWAQSRRWSFIWCNREKNQVAHWLASSCLGRNLLSLTGCIPPGLLPLLAFDVPEDFGLVYLGMLVDLLNL